MSSNIRTEVLPVIGMHCASCANIIQRTLKKVDGVESCAVQYATEEAEVVYDPQKTSITALNSHIAKLGYTLQLPKESPQVVIQDTSVKERKLQELEEMKKHLVVIAPMVAISILVMAWEVGATPLQLWPAMSPIVAEFFHHLFPLFATYALFVVGIPYLKGVIRFIRYRVANMDTLVGIGTLVAFLYSFILSAFEVPLAAYLDTTHSYYDVTIVVIGFITLGKFLESRSKLKTGEAIEKLLGLQAKSAVVIRDGKEVSVPLEAVRVGDSVVVKPGQKVPVDGVITEGSSALDESMITGEAIPVDKKPGDSVIGATLNKQGSLQIRATKVGSDTLLAQIIKMVAAAQSSHAPIEKLADALSAVFVPIVLVLSVIVFLLWLLVGSQFLPFSEALTYAVLSFVGILVIACPCAMGLATPTAVIVGVGKAASHGILIKNAESLEKLSSVNFIVLDKTGTITKGSPTITDVFPIGKYSQEQALTLLASLEKHSEHPLAQAVVAKAEAEGLSLQTVTNFSAIEGKGLRGTLDSVRYYAGNLQLVADLKLQGDVEKINQLASEGKTPVVLMTETEVIAYIALADTVKDEAAAAIERLHKMGLKVALLSGDAKQTATYIAKQVGIDRVIAEVLPGEKAAVITKLQKEGHTVAMVGDGINDAPALATADVGIAMGTGTDVAIESAGITLLGGHIAQLPKALVLSKATLSTIKQNLFWAFFYNVVGIPIAAGALYPFFGIMLNPALAGAAMAFSSVSVVLNALRLKRVRL